VHEAYGIAQRAMAELKTAVVMILAEVPGRGLSNAEIGRRLGIYSGHKGHVGHIPRTLLGMLEAEGVVTQEPASKEWSLRADSQ
jgi:hypothetical protein